MLARFVTGEHSQACSGCPCCSAAWAATLTETPWQAHIRLLLSTQDVLLRTALGEHMSEAEWREEIAKRLRGYGSLVTSTPDGYAPHIAAPEAPCPFDDDAYAPRGTPPDGFAIHLGIKKEKS